MTSSNLICVCVFDLIIRALCVLGTVDVDLQKPEGFWDLALAWSSPSHSVRPGSLGSFSDSIRAAQAGFIGTLPGNDGVLFNVTYLIIFIYQQSISNHPSLRF